LTYLSITCLVMTKWLVLGAAAALTGVACGGGEGNSGGASALDGGSHADGSVGTGGDAGRGEAGRDGSRDAPAHDANGGPDAGAEAGPDAAACAAPVTKQGAACDACITANCETTWCACRGDADNVSDAGVSGCLQYVACVEQCVADDAGTPTDCIGTVCATPTYTASEQHEGHALIDCRVSYCSTECGQ
jgi:hypothetical protein